PTLVMFHAPVQTYKALLLLISSKCMAIEAFATPVSRNVPLSVVNVWCDDRPSPAVMGLHAICHLAFQVARSSRVSHAACSSLVVHVACRSRVTHVDVRNCMVSPLTLRLGMSVPAPANVSERAVRKEKTPVSVPTPGNVIVSAVERAIVPA